MRHVPTCAPYVESLAKSCPFKWFAAPNPSVCTDGYDGETPLAACVEAMDVSRHVVR
jgi:hypothetical protein